MIQGRLQSLFWGGLLIIVGILLLLNQRGMINIGDLWPLIIVAVGLWLIIKPKTEHGQGNWSDFGDQSHITDMDEVNRSNTFGDLNVTINSADFKGGELRTTFGDLKVDLSNVRIRSGEKTLRLSTTFGDIKLNCPKDLAFSIDASSTAGDMKIFDSKKEGWRPFISYKSDNYDSAKNRLRIISSQVFGDVKVR